MSHKKLIKDNKRTGFTKVTEKLYSSFPVLLVDQVLFIHMFRN